MLFYNTTTLRAYLVNVNIQLLLSDIGGPKENIMSGAYNHKTSKNIYFSVNLIELFLKV